MNILKFKYILVIGVLFALLFPCCAEERGVSIRGKIINSDDYDFVNAFFQLVALDPAKKSEIQSATVLRDIDGNVVGIEYGSEFPKLESFTGGDFKYVTEDLQSGAYILVLQHLIPKEKPTGYFRPVPWLGRPLATDKGKIIVIEIPEYKKPPYSIDIGPVSIPESDKFIIAKFEEVSIIQP